MHFCTFAPEYNPLSTPKFHFPSISCEQNDRFSPNFIYAVIMVILSRSSLPLLHVILAHLNWVMALNLRQIFVSAQYLERTNWQIFTKLYIYTFILIRYRLGLLHVIFRTFVLVLWPLIYARFLFPLNILRTNCQIFTRFDICIYIDKI